MKLNDILEEKKKLASQLSHTGNNNACNFFFFELWCFLHLNDFIQLSCKGHCITELRLAAYRCSRKYNQNWIEKHMTVDESSIK